MAVTGYLRFPTINADTVVFVSEDDLWTVPVQGGVARRLTANLAETSRPRLSPDGALVAFTSREEDHPEVWCMPAAGGPARRVTHLGGTITNVVGWSADGRVAAVSTAEQPFRRWSMPLLVDPATGDIEWLPLGPPPELSWHPTAAAPCSAGTPWTRRGGSVTAVAPLVSCGSTEPGRAPSGGSSPMSTRTLRTRCGWATASTSSPITKASATSTRYARPVPTFAGTPTTPTTTRGSRRPMARASSTSTRATSGCWILQTTQRSGSTAARRAREFSATAGSCRPGSF